MKTQTPSLGTFPWLNGTQFGGALNDNLFKFLIIYALGLSWPNVPTDTTLAVVGAVFAFPFLLFLGASGVLADRVPKSRIIRGVKIAEILVMAFGALALYLGSGWMMIVLVFLMSTQSAVFGPSKYGIIPELVGREQIAKANSYLQAATFLAIILGTVVAAELGILVGERYHLAAFACVLVAVGGYLCSRRIQETEAAGSTRTASVFFLRDIVRSLREVRRDGFLTLAVWGGAYFLLVSAYVQLNFLSYGEQNLGLTREEGTRLFLVTAIGIGLGALLAGRLSRRNIELGLIPVGALLMTASCALLYLLPPAGVWESAPYLAGVLGVVMGIGAGLFIVPVESFIQFRSPRGRVGEVVAVSSWLSWLGVFLAAGLLFFNSKVLGLDAAGGFAFLAVLTLVMTVVAVVVLPDFCARFLVLVITRAFYRVRCSGIENIPAQGSALLVCNHVSMMDAVWLLSIQQRRIRFLIARRYLDDRHFLLRAVLRLAGVIPVQEGDNPKAIVRSIRDAREAMDSGFLVGIFPEGKFSRTGHLLPFKRGFERIVKGTGYPIVPIYIDGGFGTRASLAHGKPRLLHPADFGAEIFIAAGPPLSPESTVEEVVEAVQAQAAEASRARTDVLGSAGSVFVRAARRAWGRQAVADSTGRELTFGRTLAGALVLRRLLRRELRGDPREVAVLLPPSVGGALVNLALAMDFRVAVNLNYTAPAASVKAAIEAGRIQTVITSRKVVERLPDVPRPGRTIHLEDLLAGASTLFRLRSLLAARLLPRRLLVNDAKWEPTDPLTVLFSSGSTAAPKGVVLSHRNILSNIEGFRVVARWNPEDRILGVLPFFHSMGLTITLWFPLATGFPVAYHSHPLESEKIGKLARKYPPTIVLGSPTFMMAWVRKIAPEAFSRVRWAVVGAEKMRPALADLFEERFGRRPFEGYGATECAPVVSVNVPDVEQEGYLQAGSREGTVGRPLHNVQVRIVHPESRERLARGEDGLILVRGPNVMGGYLNDPERTASVLHDGWYDTGDIGHLDEDGFLAITDRLARFSKIGGEMVSHTSVERALQEALEVSPEALAVTSAPDERKGERLVVLYRKDSEIRPEGVQATLERAGLPNLWRPSPKMWFPVDEIPVLGSGKLDLKALKELAKEAAAGG